MRLAQVYNEPLDFVLFFSAVQSFLKAPGQSNYAAGCTFQDAFAHQLGRAWSCPVKIINWGYWGSIGIVKDAFYRERMASAGIGSIEPADGMAALHTLLNGPLPQLALVKTLRPEAIQAMEAVNLDVWLTVNPQTVPVDVRSPASPFPGHFPAPSARAARRHGATRERGRCSARFTLGNVHALGLFREPQGVLGGADRWPAGAGLLDVLPNAGSGKPSDSLELAGYLQRDRERLTVDDPHTGRSHGALVRVRGVLKPERRWQILTRKLPVVASRALPARSCLMLAGKCKATDIVFPDGAMDTGTGHLQGRRGRRLF